MDFTNLDTFVEELREGRLFFFIKKSDIQAHAIQKVKGSSIAAKVKLRIENDMLEFGFIVVEYDKEDGKIVVNNADKGDLGEKADDTVWVRPEYARHISDINTNQIINPNLPQTESIHKYLNKNGSDTSIPWDACMFTKMQLQGVKVFSSKYVIASGATINFGPVWEGGPAVNPDHKYFTIKIQRDNIPNATTNNRDSESGGSTVNLDTGIGGVEIAAPCPPIWQTL